MSLSRSPRPEYAQRKAPAVKRLLPPLSSRGARSSTVTLAPFSRAANAAHKSALPPPTISTRGALGNVDDGRIGQRFLAGLEWPGML